LIAARDAAPESASARLEALGLAYVTFAVSSPGYFRVMFHGQSKSSGPTRAGLRAFHLLRDAIVACQEAGQAPKGDPTLPFEGLEPERLGPEIGSLIARMFLSLARSA
jgi:hypothetical protein